MKLYVFAGDETDWVAANTEAEARDVLKLHYGINDEDIDGSCEEIREADPASTVFETDEVCAVTEEVVTVTAAEIMAKMKRPGLVSSTFQ